MGARLLLGVALILGLLTPRAHAVTLDRERVLRMVEEQVPWVEQEAGRSFVETPAVHIVSREQLAAQLEAELEEAMRAGLAANEVNTHRIQHNRSIVTMALALYDTGNDSLYVVSDRVEELFAETRASADLLEPVVRCVLSHELVHALQHQHADMPAPRTVEDSIAGTALIEGQAVLIQQRICEPRARRLLDAVQGTDVLASRPVGDHELMMYGYGRHYVATIEDRWGKDAVWWAFGQPPPSLDLLVAVGKDRLLAGWDDPELLAAPVRRITDARGWEVQAAPTSPVQVLPELVTGRIGEGMVPRALAGQMYAASKGKQALSLVAFVLADPSEAVDWIAARRGQAEAMRSDGVGIRVLVQGPSVVKLPSIRELASIEKRHTVDETLQIGIDTDVHTYREHWVAADGLLLGVFCHVEGVEASAINGALEALLDLGLPTVPRGGDPQQLGALLEPMTPPDPLPKPTGGWCLARDRALRLSVRQQYDGCVQTIEAAVERFGTVPGLVRVGHECVAMSGDLAESERWMGLLGGEAPGGATALGRVYHAQELWAADRSGEGLALLEGLSSDEPGLQSSIHGLRAALLIEVGRIDEGLAIVEGGNVDAQMRVAVAAALANTGRYQQALELLRGSCDEVEGEAQALCQEMLTALGD